MIKLQTLLEHYRMTRPVVRKFIQESINRRNPVSLEMLLQEAQDSMDSLRIQNVKTAIQIWGINHIYEQLEHLEPEEYLKVCQQLVTQLKAGWINETTPIDDLGEQ